MTSLNKKLATSSAEIETEGLLLEIFYRLPIHAVHRFITACKQWQSLLSDPAFRKLWRIRNLNQSSGLFLGTQEPLFAPFLPCSNEPNFPRLRNIDQSCNGLLLCSTGSRYEVYNPTTDMSFALPKLVKPAGSRILSMRLAFDPKRFGPHYKVVCVVNMFMLEFPLVYIYSSNTHSWKPVSAELSCDKLHGNGVYWNGAIHWIRGLTYFDVENERFKRMPRLPPGCGDWRKRYYFGESCDRLNYVKLWDQDIYLIGSLCIYELKRDYSEWVLKYRVSFHIEVYAMYYVVHDAKEDDDSFLVLMTRKGLTRYNLASKTSDVLYVIFTARAQVFQYIESQCSVC